MKIVKTIETNFAKTKYLNWKEKCSSSQTVSEQFYLNNTLHLEDFVHSLGLVFPDFCVVSNLVFLYLDDGTIPSENQIKEVLNKKEGQELERYLHSYNQVNLAEYFNASFSSTHKDIFCRCLEMMKLSWYYSLNKSFPHKRFDIKTSIKDGYDPIISFSQVIKKSKQNEQT